MVSLPTAEIKHTSWSNRVYEPSDDSFLLVDALKLHAPTWKGNPPSVVVEIGSGSGYVICSVARMLERLGIISQMIAIDINPEASIATAETLSNHKVQTVEVLTMDLLSGFRNNLHGLVDVLVFNPPYVPTPDEEVSHAGIARAWAGGQRGRRVTDRVLKQLPELLSERGEAFIVTVAENDPQGIIREMEDRGLHGSILLSRQADEESLSIIHLSKKAVRSVGPSEAVTR